VLQYIACFRWLSEVIKPSEESINKMPEVKRKHTISQFKPLSSFEIAVHSRSQQLIIQGFTIPYLLFSSSFQKSIAPIVAI